MDSAKVINIIIGMFLWYKMETFNFWGIFSQLFL